MKKYTLLSIFLLLLLSSLNTWAHGKNSLTSNKQSQKHAEEELSADQIIRLVRYSHALRKHDLSGYLQQNFQRTPFNLTMRENIIRFRFFHPSQIIHLDIDDQEHKLREVIKGSNSEVDPARYGEPIRGTDICYEDISLRFLYWPYPAKVDKDKKSWTIRLNNPGKSGPYGTVLIWVHKKSGGIMRMQAYNWKGKLAKRYKIVSGQKIDGVWMLKQMRVESIDPNSKKTTGRTYLHINRPKRAS